METEKLYYEDAYQWKARAVVLSCAPYQDGWRVVLDRTVFYPEGGGQPADHGTLTPDGGEAVPVTDAHERDGVIDHTCARPIPAGTAVTAQIDRARRYDHMQQHSGEHILSGILCERFHCDNVGFHLGAETVTIDYNASISREEAAEAEDAANRYLREGHPVEITYPDREALASLSYRSKKELTGQVRIVEFPGADRCACCGTHVERSSEALPVKILSCQKFREGTRLEILCGERAVRYLSRVWEEARAAGQRLSVKPEQVRAAVEKLEAERDAAKERADRLEAELFERVAAAYAGAGDAVLFREPMRPDSVRRLADSVAQTCGGLAAVFAGTDGDGWNYALVRAGGGAVDVKEMNRTLQGRGGGRGGFAQGSVKARRADIEAFFAAQGR